LADLPDEARGARPRRVQHRVSEPPRHLDVPRPHRSRREVPARDAAPLPVRADGPQHAVHAVARRGVTPRGVGAAKAKCTREEAKAILVRIEAGERVEGLGPETLLRLPDRRFFRIRGLAEFGDYILPNARFAGVGYVYLPHSVEGELLTENGQAH